MPLLLALVLSASLAQQPPAQTPPTQKPTKPASGQTPPTAPGAPGAPGGATPPQTGAPAAAPAKPQGPYEFATEIGFFYVVVRNDKAAQFDAAMGKLKQALMTSTASADRKRQASGWRVFKSSETATPAPTAAVPPPPAGAAAPAAAPATPPASATISYILMIDPVVKKMSYDPIEIMQELMPNDVQPVFDQLRESIVSITRISVTELMKMGGGS